MVRGTIRNWFPDVLISIGAGLAQSRPPFFGAKNVARFSLASRSWGQGRSRKEAYEAFSTMLEALIVFYHPYFSQNDCSRQIWGVLFWFPWFVQKVMTILMLIDWGMLQPGGTKWVNNLCICLKGANLGTKAWWIREITRIIGFLPDPVFYLMIHGYFSIPDLGLYASSCIL